MLDKKNNIKIGSNSSGNTLIQDTVINNNYTIVAPETDMLQLLSSTGNYNVIQQMAQMTFSKFKTSHPLYPDFEARYNDDLGYLISKPATSDAYKKHPLTIKSKITIDRKKYPDINSNETPWEYAYRTQKTIECKADDVKEFLGNIEDPYPSFGNGIVEKMLIQPPAFPEAVDATFSSGDISIHFKFRRKPSDEFDVIVHGNESKNLGFDFTIRYNKQTGKLVFNIKNDFSASLSIQNQREALYIQIKKTKQIYIHVDEIKDPIIIGVDDEAFLKIFVNAEILCRYTQNLLFIEACLGKHFNVDLSNVEYDDYIRSCVIVSSLKHEWHLHYLPKESIEDFPMDAINKDELNANKDKLDLCLAFDTHDYHFSIGGVNFVVDTFKSIYQKFVISNIDELLSADCMDNRTLFLVPQEGEKNLSLYMIFEGLQVEQNEESY